MHVLIVGCDGQLGRELHCSCPGNITLSEVDKRHIDITKAEVVSEYLARLQIDVVINAAAYTAVDQAETEEALAYAVNASGAANLAQAASQQGARFIQISTDFVFDGKKSTPYSVTDTPSPVSVYGASKLAGEQQALVAHPDALIIRTSWLYSHFCANFVKTMLKLMAEREQLSVVDDQIGTPTWAAGLARFIWDCAQQPDLKGVYHWSDTGVASWYDFAIAIQEEAAALDVIPSSCKIFPIPGAEYPTPATRPAYSVMDKTQSYQQTSVEPLHWREALRQMLKLYKEQGDS